MVQTDSISSVLAAIPKNVQVLAATKGRTVEEIHKAIDAGIHILGENYVQEAEEKYLALKGKAKLHLIGHLQKNKVKRALEIFDMIQTIDSFELAEEISKRAKKPMEILIQVNIGEEGQKSGCDPKRAIDLIKGASRLPNVRIGGIMAMAPYARQAEDARPYFRKMKELFDEISQLKIPNVKMETLSMGMSHDYQIAIEEGATMVRLGSALFGERKER